MIWQWIMGQNKRQKNYCYTMCNLYFEYYWIQAQHILRIIFDIFILFDRLQTFSMLLLSFELKIVAKLWKTFHCILIFHMMQNFEWISKGAIRSILKLMGEIKRIHHTRYFEKIAFFLFCRDNHNELCWCCLLLLDSLST